MNSTFAHNIKLIREVWGLSQEAFGEMVGASRMAIAQYELRGSKPKYFVRNAIEEVTGFSYENLCDMTLNKEDVSMERGNRLCLSTDIHSRIIVAISALKDAGIIGYNYDIAKDLGYSRQGTISEIINGKKPVSIKFLNAFASKYSVSIDWLKTGDGHMFHAQPTTGSDYIIPPDSTNIDNEFSVFLKDRRSEFGLTRAMLSHFSGKPLADITAWEEGTAVASPEIQADLYLYFKSLQNDNAF